MRDDVCSRSENADFGRAFSIGGKARKAANVPPAKRETWTGASNNAGKVYESPTYIFLRHFLCHSRHMIGGEASIWRAIYISA
jgi:hypothetical protein